LLAGRSWHGHVLRQLQGGNRISCDLCFRSDRTGSRSDLGLGLWSGRIENLKTHSSHQCRNEQHSTPLPPFALFLFFFLWRRQRLRGGFGLLTGKPVAGLRAQLVSKDAGGRLPALQPGQLGRASREVLNPLTVKMPSDAFHDITIYPGYWINRGMANYYGKKTVVALPFDDGE
jgi:hypothetical protein